MTAISFETAELLAQYVTTNSITAANIVQIVENDGRWYIFHF